jgi:magnesium-transporting ATPase (P-type)
MDIYAPVSAIWPLCFILLVSMLKDGYEDFKRHRSDKFINSKPVRIYRDGRFSQFKSEEILVGDFILVNMFDLCFCILLINKR